MLRALCLGVLQGDAREQAVRMLATHRFANPEHALLFAALSTLPAAEAGILREQLPARLTVLGFPEMDLDPYIRVPAPDAGEVRDALNEIARGAKPAGGSVKT